MSTIQKSTWLFVFWLWLWVFFIIIFTTYYIHYLQSFTKSLYSWIVLIFLTSANHSWAFKCEIRKGYYDRYSNFDIGSCDILGDMFYIFWNHRFAFGFSPTIVHRTRRLYNVVVSWLFHYGFVHFCAILHSITVFLFY